MAAKIKTPSCDRCKKSLPIYEVSYSHQNGRLPTLFGGVVCTRCGKFECMTCKQGRPERPCSWCGYPVAPADEDEVAAKKKGKLKQDYQLWTTIRQRWAQIGIFAGLAVILTVLALPAYQLYWPQMVKSAKSFMAITTPADIPDPQRVFVQRDRPPFTSPENAAPAQSEKAEPLPGPVAALTPAASPYAPLPEPQRPDRLAGMNGRRVHVVTTDGRIIEGFMTLLKSDMIALKQSYNSGMFSMTLRRNEIDTVSEAPLQSAK